MKTLEYIVGMLRRKKRYLGEMTVKVEWANAYWDWPTDPPHVGPFNWRHHEIENLGWPQV